MCQRSGKNGRAKSSIVAIDRRVSERNKEETEITIRSGKPLQYEKTTDQSVGDFKE
jgi:hypothetical protein